MGYKLKHPCAWRGCPQLVSDKERYCVEHKKYVDRFYNNTRGDVRQYWSQSPWRRIRKEFLRKYPMCSVCGAPATEVHHIIPLKKGGSNSPYNLRPLCKRCHSAITAKQGRWGGGY